MQKADNSKPPKSNPLVNAVKNEYPSGVVISPRTGKPKRRKATRACVHCQRTHLTCDNNRPCERCVARGLADTCQDGTRKKAKYLQDVPESLASSSDSKKFDPRYKKKGLIRSDSASSSESLLSVVSLPAQLGDMYGGAPPSHPPPHHASISGPINQQELMRPPPIRSVSLFAPNTESGTSFQMNQRTPPLQAQSQQVQQQAQQSTHQVHHRQSQPQISPHHQSQQSQKLHPRSQSQPEPQSQPSLFAEITNQITSQPHPHQPGQSSQQPSNQHRKRGTFESSATTQEYSVLSSILHGNSTPSNISLSDINMTSPAFSDDSTRTDNSNLYHANYLNQFTLGNSPRHNLTEILANVDMSNQANDWLNDAPKQPPISFTIADTIDNLIDPDFKLLEEELAANNNPQTQQLQSQSINKSTDGNNTNNENNETNENNNNSINANSLTTPANYTTTARLNTRLGGFSNTGSWQPTKKPADIYRNVRQPFPYTPGFHSLIKYLKSRFDKLQLIQMAKCMAKYRPSFIACTNSLDQDDLVFMEQCFQRTLLEYEKYISYSGTPTVIWRRTGQIAAVGKEFCILTGWNRQQLLDRDGSGTGGMFIVEVMQDESVLEYFQMFSDISFGDSQGATMSECSLLTPNGKTIRTSSMWTLKRDVFGIPMMIVGNFLPILS